MLPVFPPLPCSPYPGSWWQHRHANCLGGLKNKKYFFNIFVTIVSWLVCPKERRRLDNIYTIFIYCSITDKNIPFQSGSGIYERAKLTNPQYKHRVLYLKRMVVFHWFRPVSRTALGKLNCWFSVVGVWKVDYKIKMQVLILNNYDVIEESYNLC